MIARLLVRNDSAPRDRLLAIAVEAHAPTSFRRPFVYVLAMRAPDDFLIDAIEEDAVANGWGDGT